jgi:WD40 repeat protein
LAVAVHASGRIAVAGNTNGEFPGETRTGVSTNGDIFVRLYDADRSVLWTRQLGGRDRDWAEDVAFDASGNVVVAGWLGSASELPGFSSQGYSDGYVRKYDPSGNELWTRQLASSARDYARGVAADSSGNVVVTGSGGALEGQASGGVFVRKYDPDGTVLWTRQFSAGYGVVAIDSSDNVIVGGDARILPDQTALGSDDGFVRKYDPSGNELWTDQFGSTEYEQVRAISVGSDDTVMATGSTRGDFPGETNAGRFDGFIRVYSSSGVALWTDQFGTSATEFVLGAAADAFGNFAAVGYIDSGAFPGETDLGGWDMFVLVYDSAGALSYTEQFGTDANERPRGSCYDGSGNLFVTGSVGAALAGETYYGSGDAFVVQIPPR